MRTLYADCFSGVSGDMLLGALLDLGVSIDTLQAGLEGLALSGYELDVRTIKEKHLRASRLIVTFADKHPHRSWGAIQALLESAVFSPFVKNRSIAAFTVLAEAEARVHGCAETEVLFHEVGGVDAMVDVVGSAICLEALGVERMMCSPLPLARGWTKGLHGALPLPAPATLAILHDVPVFGLDLDFELVTPTGAALVKAWSHAFGPFPPMTVERVGYGAGARQRPDHRPNLLRLVLGETRETNEAQEVEVVETHLDDWSPEGFPFLMERLFAKGALDVVLCPIHMKKGRPGFLLRVLADPATAWEIKRCVLSETSAIGLRFHKESRWTLPRSPGTVPTKWGAVRVKRVETPEGPVLYPEYEDCQRLAREHGLSLKEVYAEVGRHGDAEFQAND